MLYLTRKLSINWNYLLRNVPSLIIFLRNGNMWQSFRRSVNGTKPHKRDELNDKWHFPSIWIKLHNTLVVVAYFITLNKETANYFNVIHSNISHEISFTCTRRNASIPWKLKDAIQSSFSHHSVDWMTGTFQWPFSDLSVSFSHHSIAFQ